MRSKPVNLRGATILVVDDTDANRAVLCQLLDSQGYTVAAASSGEIALKLVQSDPPELILLDVVMPGFGGFETCRRLKADPLTEHIPIIFITAQDETRSVEWTFESLWPTTLRQSRNRRVIGRDQRVEITHRDVQIPQEAVL